jgi:hypothetical protein
MGKPFGVTRKSDSGDYVCETELTELKFCERQDGLADGQQTDVSGAGRNLRPPHSRF